MYLYIKRRRQNFGFYEKKKQPHILKCNSVPNQAPEITKIYLTSATSIKVFWTPVTEGPIDGYQVAFRPINEERWGTVAVDRNTTTLHQTNLQEGMVYRIRVMAFNESGNGLPGEAEEIMMEEEGKLLLSCSTNDKGEKIPLYSALI